VSLVASWSRSPDPIGRIWRAQGFILLDDLLRWQEQWHGVRLELGISFNKVVLLSLRRPSVLMLFHGVTRSPVMFCVEPSRWWLGVGCRSGEASFNKRFLPLIWLWSLLQQSPLLTDHGGMEEGRPAVSINSGGGDWENWDTDFFWSFLSAAYVWLPNQVADSQHLQTLAPALHQVFFNLQWRPSSGIASIFLSSSAPCGLDGAGGGDCSLKPELTVGVGGPDCFFYNLIRVCFASCKGSVCTVFSLGVLYVSCTTPLLY